MYDKIINNIFSCPYVFWLRPFVRPFMSNISDQFFKSHLKEIMLATLKFSSVSFSTVAVTKNGLNGTVTKQPKQATGIEVNDLKK